VPSSPTSIGPVTVSTLAIAETYSMPPWRRPGQTNRTTAITIDASRQTIKIAIRTFQLVGIGRVRGRPRPPG
jgi:hypothetical protein